VDILAEFAIEIDVYQQRIDIVSLIKKSKLTENSIAIMETEENQRIGTARRPMLQVRSRNCGEGQAMGATPG
jgi:hypothetical protein